MVPYLVLWIVLVPALGAAISPAIAALAPRNRAVDAYYVIAHLAVLALAGLALSAPSSATTFGLRGAPTSARLLLVLDRQNASQLLFVATLFLAIGAFGHGFVGDARHGRAFLTGLLWQQAAVNLVLVSADLLALYGGLLLLSFTLILMIGLDFGAAGGSAALRVFATLEVPAAVALASLWVIDARAETAALSDLAQSAPWLTGPGSPVLAVPIVVALISRAGLIPFQKWVAVGCRAAAGPVAVAIAGIAVPVGAVVFAREVRALPLDPSWLNGLEVIGAGSATIAAIAALRERSSRGWLAYVAVAQMAFATVGFAENREAGTAAAWLSVANGALIVTLLGLGLAVALKATGQDALPRASSFSGSRLTAIATSIGYLAVATVPPFGAFAARRSLVASLLERGSTIDLVGVGGVLLATGILGAATWRSAFALLAPTPAEAETAIPRSTPLRAGSRRADRRARTPKGADPPSSTLGRASLAAIAGMGLAVLATGIVPLSWLASALELSLPTANALADMVASVLVGATVGGALVWHRIFQPLASTLPRPDGRHRALRWLQQHNGLERLSDPYLVVGGILTTLGRLSAAVLDILGRLVRAN